MLGKEKKRSLFKKEQILANRGKERQFQGGYSVKASAREMVYVSEQHHTQFSQIRPADLFLLPV